MAAIETHAPNDAQVNAAVTRALYMVLSPAALPYARFAIESLFAGSAQSLHLHLITDSTEDRAALIRYMESIAVRFFQPDSQTITRGWSVYSAADVEAREAEQFSLFPHLRAFRRGHPCWRKITDPLLLATPGAEMVLLDPDLYFPNDFTFEPTPSSGLLLMWQKPNCLVPQRVVLSAMESGIRLANHVDIGVAQWRGPEDIEWLEWLVGRLAGGELPRLMHIEAIVWSALAMKMGGGYLNPQAWHCWRRTQTKRVKRLLHVRGETILRSEPWAEMKCFHGGGEAKWWIPEAVASGTFKQRMDRMQPTNAEPFVELTRSAYDREQRVKWMLRKVGYYSLIPSA